MYLPVYANLDTSMQSTAMMFTPESNSVVTNMLSTNPFPKLHGVDTGMARSAGYIADVTMASCVLHWLCC